MRRTGVPHLPAGGRSDGPLPGSPGGPAGLCGTPASEPGGRGAERAFSSVVGSALGGTAGKWLGAPVAPSLCLQTAGLGQSPPALERDSQVVAHLRGSCSFPVFSCFSPSLFLVSCRFLSPYPHRCPLSNTWARKGPGSTVAFRSVAGRARFSLPSPSLPCHAPT